MRALRTLVLALLILVIAVCATAGPAKAVRGPIPLGFCLQQGWYGGTQAWWTFFGSNNIDWVRNLCLTQRIAITFKQNLALYLQSTEFALYPKLGSALAGGSSPVYFVTNFQQGPVFTAIPSQASYSGLWQVNLITWKPGVTPRPINDASNLPSPAEADIVALDVIIDAPILATGQLGGPWGPAPAGRYRIPQALGVEQFGPYKVIVLPAWPSYATNEITKASETVFLVITDTADPALAAHLLANYAPALAAVDDANTQKVWYFKMGQVPPVPPAQYQVLEHTVTLSSILSSYVWYRPLNELYDVSPVMDLQPLVRGTIPSYVTVNNPALLQRLLASGGLLPSGGPVRVNTFLGTEPIDD